MTRRNDDPDENKFLSNFSSWKPCFPSWVNILKIITLLLAFVIFIFLVRKVVGENGVVDLLTSLVWPLAIVVIAMTFRKAIEGFAERMTEISAPGFAARARSYDVARQAYKLESEQLEENNSNENINPDEYAQTEKDSDFVKNTDHSESESFEDNRKSDSCHPDNANKINSSESDEVCSADIDNQNNDLFHCNKNLDYDALRERLSSLVSERVLPHPSSYRALRSYNKKVFENKHISYLGALSNERNKILISSWDRLSSVIDELYTDNFYDKLNLPDFQKMKRLFYEGKIAHEQLDLFKKLHEAEDMFSHLLDKETKENYLYTILNLENSLSKLVISK